MNKENLATDFRDVDAANIQKITHCLDGMQAMPFFKKYKDRTLELLTDGLYSASAIDIGCGLGDDVVRLARHFTRAVGVDASSALINEAIKRHEGTNCKFYCADAAELPFADAEFDCARIDRSLQHMPDPGKIVREMLRVVRPGGKVLCAEPDWGTFFVGAPVSDIAKAIQDHWAMNIQNPWIGRTLLSIMKIAGVKNVAVEAHVLITDGFEASNLVFDIGKIAQNIGDRQQTSNEVKKWLDDYRTTDAIAGATIFLCHGIK